jgi:hypothetical protein
MYKYLKKYFCENEKPSLKFLDGKFEDLKRINKMPPKRESLILYRHTVKTCKKFFWRNHDGRLWSEILLKSARNEFETNRNLMDSAEVGKQIVIGKQALIELDEKIIKVQSDLNQHFDKTRNQ